MEKVPFPVLMLMLMLDPGLHIFLSIQARIQDFEMGVNFCNNVTEPKPG